MMVASTEYGVHTYSSILTLPYLTLPYFSSHLIGLCKAASVERRSATQYPQSHLSTTLPGGWILSVIALDQDIPCSKYFASRSMRNRELTLVR